MPFPLPTPTEIAEQVRARQETALIGLRPDVSMTAIARAVRSQRGVLATVTGAYAPVAYETHLHLRWWGDQYFPDTAEREQLERHADIWGVYRRPATRAIGRAMFTGLVGATIPLGVPLITPSGALVETTEAATLVTGTANVAVRAIDAGLEANVGGGAVLPIVTPVAGLDPQSATLDADGLAGGAEVESDASLLERLLDTIREPGHGGADFDYVAWVKNAFPAAKVRAVRNWVGRGSVGVVVAMGDAAAPRAPTNAERDAIAAHLDVLRPVTAEVIVAPVVLQPLPLTIALTPDALAVRAAVTSAYALFLAREADIGGAVARSRLSEALSAASGEYSHALMSPTADVAVAENALVTPGPITWVSP